ncbi:unnamed protein product [Rhizoctonia solani]|uniref:Protein kinase domain-containing protein n=1 Tax=Rhizoctonia solani TaxID=456999 RepID=A0A8H3AJX3_9AGAM|nr:unnamed protein product [Rhizoctonia solani]
MAVLMGMVCACACAPTTICSKMDYRDYEDRRPPLLVTSADGDPQYYANSLEGQSFGPVMPEPWRYMPPKVNRSPTQDFGTQENHAPSSHVFPYRPGSTSRQSLHVVTNASPINNNDTWPRRSPGMNLVQSPSSYLPPSPNAPGVPSVPRHKVVEITFNGESYVRLDLTRHTDASAIRRDMISRIPSSAATPSNFDIFRIHPPGSNGALNDWQLMLDVEHFGDDYGTLKFLVQATDVYSNSRLQNYATTPSSLKPPDPTPFPFPTPAPFSRSSTINSDGRYSPYASTPDTRRYTYSPSQPLDRYPARTPSNRVSMPIPMPAPAPTPIQPPRFPTPSPSTYHASSSSFPTPITENSPGHLFVGRPVSMPVSPLESQHLPGNMEGYSRYAPAGYGRENRDGGIINGRDGENWHGAGRASARPQSVVINGTMTTDEVLSHLYERGCRNVTDQLDESRIGRDPVARGGGGDVYSGELRTGEQVALKCVRLAIGTDDQNKLKTTAHELYVWSKCNHPNVLELIGITHYRGQIAMVSPWMENGDLRAFLRLYPDADRRDLCMQITDGVAYLHSQTIVHGDIKGANILISQDGVAKITDFGTSALKEYTLQFAATKSKPGLSVRWAAPEVLEEKSENSYQADVYALGMTILEAITGKVPYAHITRDCAVMRHVIDGVLPIRPEAHILGDDCYGDALWSLLNRCWAYDSRNRPTATEIQYQMKFIPF